MDDAASPETPIPLIARPLSPRRLAALAWLSARLPNTWLSSVRRRRLLFLALAAPGFLAVFTTTLHHNFFVLVAGFFLFGAAALFRAISEPAFVQAEAANIWPPDGSPLPSRSPSEFPHA